jgi:colicin import membrane protein
MSKEKANSKESKSNKYQPKATVRHDKIARSRKDELASAKEKISNDKYMAKKAEARRRKAIKDLPKEERAAARTQLKEDIVRRKAAHKEAKEKYKANVIAERERREAEEDKEDSDNRAKALESKKKKSVESANNAAAKKTSAKKSKEIPTEDVHEDSTPEQSEKTSEEPIQSSGTIDKK